MRDKLVANISDVLKLAFLRALVSHDRSLGVARYYVPGEHGRFDADDLEWRHESAWQQLDPDLYEALIRLPERSVAALERLPIWPEGTYFHRQPIPTRRERDAWGASMQAELSEPDIIYLDPDVGLGKPDLKHATLTELKGLRKMGRSVAFITFPGKSKPFEAQLEELHRRLRDEANVERILTLGISVCVPYTKGGSSCVPRARWLTVIDPDDTLIERTRTLADALKGPRVSLKVHLVR